MAFAFTTGTINQPDAGSVGLAMAEKLRDDVVAHAAWDLVEEFTAASGLVRWYVFKCLAAQSGLPSDFFVVMGRTLGSGELRFFICELYDSATHAARHFCQAAPSASPVVAYDSAGRVPAATTYILGTAVLTGSGATPAYNSWTPSGTSTKWWLIVTDDGFTAAFSGASNGAVHCGVYIPLTTFSIAMPIHIFGAAGNGPAWDGHITRNPAAANLATGAGTGLQTKTAPAASVAPALGPMGDLALNDALQGGGRSVAEQGISINQALGTSAGYPVYGWFVGKVKRMRINTTTPPAGFTFGDAYVLQGRLWVPYLASDGRMWDTGVAA